MHENTRLAATHGLGNGARAQRCSKCHVAARQRLAYREDVRHDTRMLHRKQAPGATEPGGNFIKDQQ